MVLRKSSQFSPLVVWIKEKKLLLLVGKENTTSSTENYVKVCKFSFLFSLSLSLSLCQITALSWRSSTHCFQYAVFWGREVRCAGRGRSRTLPAFPLLLLFLLLHSKKKIKSGDCLMRERVTVSGEIVVSRQTYKPRERRLCIYAYCSLSHSHGLLRGVYFYFFFSLFDHVSQCFSCLTNITRFSFF